MTLEFDNKSAEIHPRPSGPLTGKRRLTYPARQSTTTGGAVPFSSLTGNSGEMVYSLTAADPEIDLTSGPALNPYSGSFFAFWLLGFLAVAGAHFV